MPILREIKEAYTLWYSYYLILVKTHRHSLGIKVDNLFIEVIESIATAIYLSKEEKLPWLKLAIRKTGTLTILLMILWETKSLDDKKYIALSLKIEEFGRKLGGWKGKIEKEITEKQNSLAKSREK